MFDLSSHMTRTNCEKKPTLKAKNNDKAAVPKAKDNKRGEDFDATVDSVSELIHTCEDCGECFEGEADEHKKACGAGAAAAAAAAGEKQGKGEEPAATADGGVGGGNSSPEVGGQR